ncbi:hypothetical protein [Mariprofundus ferrooxydans]|uniref:hypothetical protein n=1 Tax=Mariprofundus ferrooxydans TaxID=314344 RepID=UPI00142F5355|nr:hypothetical protein [Mariprofundus ferrooxydans]
MDAKINRSHIGKEILTTIAASNIETRVYDGRFVEGPHAQEYGAVLHEHTDIYRLYYSFHGVGVDIIAHNIHLVLTTSDYGTPLHEYMWLFIGQSAVGRIFSEEVIPEYARIMISQRMLHEHHHLAQAFLHQIDKLICDD